MNSEPGTRETLFFCTNASADWRWTLTGRHVLSLRKRGSAVVPPALPRKRSKIRWPKSFSEFLTCILSFHQKARWLFVAWKRDVEEDDA